jgi:hypothetical protein
VDRQGRREIAKREADNGGLNRQEGRQTRGRQEGRRKRDRLKNRDRQKREDRQEERQLK